MGTPKLQGALPLRPISSQQNLLISGNKNVSEGSFNGVEVQAEDVDKPSENDAADKSVDSKMNQPPVLSLPKKKQFYIFSQTGQTSALTPEHTQMLFRKQAGLPDGRYMPESPHFNDNLTDFQDEQKVSKTSKNAPITLVVVSDELTLGETTQVLSSCPTTGKSSEPFQLQSSGSSSLTNMNDAGENKSNSSAAANTQVVITSQTGS